MDTTEKKTCACGLEPVVEGKPFPYDHGSGTCLVQGKWIPREQFQLSPRELVAAALKNGTDLEAERRDHQDTQALLRRANEEAAANWREAERWKTLGIAAARIVSGDDTAPAPVLERWAGGPMKLVDG